MTEPDLDRPNRWTWLSYAYATLVVLGIGLSAARHPDSGLGQLRQSRRGSGRDAGIAGLRSVPHARDFSGRCLWAHIRIVYDLSGGDYYAWFRGWHVGQVAVLTILFLRLVRPRTAVGRGSRADRTGGVDRDPHVRGHDARGVSDQRLHDDPDLLLSSPRIWRSAVRAGGAMSPLRCCSRLLR